MAGYQTVLMVERIKERADKLGFMLCYPRHGWSDSKGSDLVSIKPKDADSLPVYSRDAQLFTGTLDELNAFFAGLEWSRDYDRMLRVSTEKSRQRKEQDERNRQLAKILVGSDNSGGI